jgi:hypothetical protein
MANSKISALTSATTPLAGTETLPIVQSSTTKQVSVANFTAGRAVSAASLTLTISPLPVSSGGTGATSFTAGQVLFGSFSQSSSLFWDNTNKYLGVGTSSPAAGVEVSTADLTTIFLTNPTTTGATTGAGIGFKVYNGSSVAQNGSIFSTSSTWSFGTYSANQLNVSADGSGGVRIASATAPIGFYTGGAYSGISTKRMEISSAGDVTVNTGNLVIGTSGNGLTSTGTITVKSSNGGTNWQVFSSANATNPAFFVNGSGSVNGIGTGANGAASAMYVNRDTGSLRSINAAGSINASGADYAEYMVKDGDFVLAKGDICGIKANGKLTNVFSDAISFAVKSTDPSYVGGDTWFNEQPPQPPIELIEPTVLVESEDTTDEQRIQYQTTLAQYQSDFEQYQSDLAIYNADLASWKQRLEAARSPVDRIAFCGQVPVNVQGAIAGQYIIPINDNGAIKGQAISDPTFEQYKNAIGKVIAIEADGRAKIIVKIS